MDSWGSTTINVTAYGRVPGTTFFSEKDLLPDPTSLSGPQTILQGGGRRRKRREIEGYCSKETFDDLETDYYSSTARTLTCDDGFSMSAIIEKFSAATRKLGCNQVFFTVTFIEA